MRSKYVESFEKYDVATCDQIRNKIWELPEVKEEWARMNEKFAQELE